MNWIVISLLPIAINGYLLQEVLLYFMFPLKTNALYIPPSSTRAMLTIVIRPINQLPSKRSLNGQVPATFPTLCALQQVKTTYLMALIFFFFFTHFLSKNISLRL